jgi:class 3 adenylate cyclase
MASPRPAKVREPAEGTPVANFYSLMVIDIENFSGRSNPVQTSLRAAMYEVMDAAAQDAHLPWDRVVTEDRGDGMLLVIPPDLSQISLAGDLVDALRDVLAEKARMYSAEHTLRMRVALHQGMVTRDVRGWSGDAVNFTFRLCDAEPLRVALRDTAGALLAFIVSDEFYQAVVRHGYRSIDTGSFAAIRFDAKNLPGIPAWVRVPGVPAPLMSDGPTRPPGPRSPGGSPPPAIDPSVPAPGSGGGMTIMVNGTVNGGIAGRDQNYGDGWSHR